MGEVPYAMYPISGLLLEDYAPVHVAALQAVHPVLAELTLVSTTVEGFFPGTLMSWLKVHSTQYTVHSTQYTVHSTQYTIRSTQYTVHRVSSSLLLLKCLI
jgi:hypothetical protein